MKHIGKQWLCLVLTIVFVLAAGPLPSMAEEALEETTAEVPEATAEEAAAQEQTLEADELHAAAAVVMDGETGEILFEKNGTERRAMASTTKIMTLLVALEYGDFTEPVTVSANAARQPKVRMNLKEGESFWLIDLLYAMMLVSYNDAAVAVAEAVAGDVESFCYLMNLKARHLGAFDTHFVTPNGLDAENHFSTAADMARIARAALDDEEAMQIMQTRSYTIQQDEINCRNVQLVNKNPLLSTYTAAIGGKTGYTNEAGLCLVGLAERDGVQVVSVVLGSGWPPHSNYRVADTVKLFDFGFKEANRQRALREAAEQEIAEEKWFRRIVWNVCKSIWPSAVVDPAENVKSGSAQVW